MKRFEGRYYNLSKLLLIILFAGLAICIAIDAVYPQTENPYPKPGLESKEKNDTPLQIGMNNSEAGEWANNAGGKYDETTFDKETGWAITQWSGGAYKDMKFKFFRYAILKDRVVATSLCLDTLLNEQGSLAVQRELAKVGTKVGWTPWKVEDGSVYLQREQQGLVMILSRKAYGPLYAPLIIILEVRE